MSASRHFAGPSRTSPQVREASLQEIRGLSTLDNARLTTDAAYGDLFTRLISRVGFFKHTPGPLAVRQMFQKRLGVPFAAFCREKITAIDVDGASKFIDGIYDRVNDISAQGFCIHFTKRLCASSFDLV